MRTGTAPVPRSVAVSAQYCCQVASVCRAASERVGRSVRIGLISHGHYEEELSRPVDEDLLAKDGEAYVKGDKLSLTPYRDKVTLSLWRR